MKRNLTRIKPHRLVEIEFAPGGFGANYHDPKKARQSLVARWTIAADVKLLCQWIEA